MTKEFYDRTEEINLLRHRYANLEHGEMLVVYGRRRVGKTELIKEFMTKITDSNKLYTYVDLAGKQELLASLSNTVQEQLGETFKFSDFESFLSFINEKAKKDKFLLVIDEFQRFLDVAPEFITKLQNRWDNELRHSKLMLILVGSSMGMIQRITESRAGALYGRGTKIKISPFRYVDFRLMFKDLGEIEKVERYAVFGGTPFYLAKTTKFPDTMLAISELILKKGGELAEEPKNLLEYENVRIHAKYNSILHAISSGKEILKEMQEFTRIDSTAMPAYIARLDELLDLVKKNDPVRGKKRLGRYAIKDNFFRFWYKFIFPNQTALNIGNYKLVSDIIKENLNSYTGLIFEDIAMELFMLYLNKEIKGVKINFENIGRWWDRNGNEIDLVAYNDKEKTALIGEVKWTNAQVDTDILHELIRKAGLLSFNGRIQYVIVSKSGFTEKCIAKMEELGVLHLDLSELTKLFDAIL